jgi:hypothetical protein
MGSNDASAKKKSQKSEVGGQEASLRTWAMTVDMNKSAGNGFNEINTE